jgi:2-polyprenyl-3-methyl-5-hydroxy-6-metoxy-1,4-benzoquinol methylase
MADAPADHLDQVRQLFDALAVTWPGGYAPEGRFAGRLARFTVALDAYLAPRSHVLDLGCGTGEMACVMAASSFRTTACDISEKMLQGAQSNKNSGSVDWVLLEPHWRKLPFSSGNFDAVVASSVLEYVEEPAVVFGECARVLKPAGVMLCTVPDPKRLVRRLERFASVTLRSPLAGAASHRWPSLQGQMTYLKVSKQRHPVRWWSTAAASAGLRPIPHLPDTEKRSALRLLGFRRPNDPGDNSWLP